MGQIDIAAKEYMKDSRRFADAFNGGLFKGKKVIDPDKLRELDPEEILLPDMGSDKTARKKERDLLKCASVMTDGITTCVILGIEDQTMIDYSMPVRTMLYDAMRYGNQVKALSKKNREEKRLTGDDFTSGLRKEDRLLPVITLVFYLGSEEWDGAKSIHEMLVPCDESIKGRTADYKLNLIDPSKLNDEEC